MELAEPTKSSQDKNAELEELPQLAKKDIRKKSWNAQRQNICPIRRTAQNG